MPINFSPYELIDYDESYLDSLIGLLCRIYSQFDRDDLGIKGELVELNGLDSDLLNIPEIYKAPNTFKLLIDPNKNNKLIGTVAIKIRDDGDAEIKRVFLDRSLRGQGLGKKLSLWAFEYAKSQGAQLMHIWSGTFCYEAHKLYKELGAKDMNEKRLLGGIKKIEEYYFTKDLV